MNEIQKLLRREATPQWLTLLRQQYALDLPPGTTYGDALTARVLQLAEADPAWAQAAAEWRGSAGGAAADE